MNLKILTWNIFWGMGAPTSSTHQKLHGLLYLKTTRDRAVIPKIAKRIKQLSPDIVALQEIDNGSVRNGKYDHIGAISSAARLPFSHFAVEKAAAKYFGDGNALLSKEKPLRVAHRTLPYSIEKRNYVLAEYEREGKRFVVITTHLAARRFNSAQRLSQVKELCRVIRKIKHPIIVAADLNCNRDTEEFKYLVKNSKLRAIIDESTYPVYNPQKQYDCILVSKKWKVKEARVVKTKLSDHYPIYAELKI